MNVERLHYFTAKFSPIVATLIFLTQIVGKTLWSSIQLRKFSPSNYFPYLLLYSAKVLTVENLDEWLAIHKSFPYKPLSLNVSPLKPTINSSKLFIRQSISPSNFCTIKLKCCPSVCPSVLIFWCHIANSVISA